MEAWVPPKRGRREKRFTVHIWELHISRSTSSPVHLIQLTYMTNWGYFCYVDLWNNNNNPPPSSSRYKISCCWQKITRVIPRSDIPFQEEWLWQQKISTFTDFTLQYKSSSKMVLFTNCGYWKFSPTALGPHIWPWIPKLRDASHTICGTWTTDGRTR